MRLRVSGLEPALEPSLGSQTLSQHIRGSCGGCSLRYRRLARGRRWWMQNRLDRHVEVLGAKPRHGLVEILHRRCES
ncbi:MAG: hypothetical protein ABW318_10860, partial [Vicinamibacterales bacterium]